MSWWTGYIFPNDEVFEIVQWFQTCSSGQKIIEDCLSREKDVTKRLTWKASPGLCYLERVNKVPMVVWMKMCGVKEV